MKKTSIIAIFTLFTGTLCAEEYHVSVQGNDQNPGSRANPLKTLSAAAQRAQPGDIITVHSGTYRERINPPRGGTSDTNRIVYQAAKGERVTIKGSEVVTGWERVQEDVWKVTLPETFFRDYNPFKEVISGDWFNRRNRDHHTGAVYLDGHWLTEAAGLDDVLGPAGNAALWFASGATNTTIWAQFKGVDPNEAGVEINVRQTVFYPQEPGINYITVRGFKMMHAATPWAPPTAEQIGLIGTHWSKGWVIENNDIRYSTCVGVTLGKYGDAWDNKSQSADAYNRTIRRAMENGWSKENIGHHIVRNNTIAHCEQAGVVGSLGAAFSTISGNDIHDIHVRQLFSGAEMAGIKIHAAIDTVISGNHIYRACRGIWLDWMAQGTRVTANLLHDNNTTEDLFVEVNHGPFLVDNNLFLSSRSLWNMSEGGAYVHNLMLGQITLRSELSRSTPFHEAHSTDIAGLHNIRGGDDRFYNNLIVKPASLAGYNGAARPVLMGGNVFLEGAEPSKNELDPLVPPAFHPAIKLDSGSDGVSIEIVLDMAWRDERQRRVVTTDLLRKAQVSDLPYEQPDGAPYRLDTDFFGNPRCDNPFPGPFEVSESGKQVFTVWPNPAP